MFVKKTVTLALCTGGVLAAITAYPAVSDEQQELQPPALRTPAPALKDGPSQSTYLEAPRVNLGTDRTTQGLIPGVGPNTMAQLPSDARQVLVATSAQPSDTASSLRLYEYRDGKWQHVKAFASHNGRAGWRENRTEGDETTPAGVFSLSDAGGTLKNPGSKLPYTQDTNLSATAQNVYGPDYAEVFDYVIAIDFNRVTGTAPTNTERPHGKKIGGGIWLHVDHGKGTNGCVTVQKDDMAWLLRKLDPGKNPHIVMGDQAFISK